MKMETAASDLVGDEFSELAHFFTHVTSLKYQDTPNYDYLKRLLRHVLVARGARFRDLYDWERPEVSARSSLATPGAATTFRAIATGLTYGYAKA